MATTISTIFELLPKTDCRQCVYTSCCAFATALADGNAALSGCPAIAAESKTVIAKIIEEHRNAAPPIIQPKEVEKTRGLSLGKKLVLLPLQATWLLVFTFPLSAPIWLFIVWLFLR